nr:BFH_HP1_G0048570.mRNA.1.CDS.1 [Saccharomyces cerevisiae]
MLIIAAISNRSGLKGKNYIMWVCWGTWHKLSNRKEITSTKNAMIILYDIRAAANCNSFSVTSMHIVLVCGLLRTAATFLKLPIVLLLLPSRIEAFWHNDKYIFESTGFVVNRISIILSIGGQIGDKVTRHVEIIKGFKSFGTS